MNLKMSFRGAKNVSFIFGLILCCSVARAEYYTSVVGLEELLKTEQILLRDLKDYVVTTNQENSVLENEINKIQREHKSAYNDTQDYLTNPINVYRLVKRLYNDWWLCNEHVTNSTDFLQLMSVRYNELAFPSYNDFEESARALMRLQNTYNLDVTQLASGILNGRKYGTSMSWTDCLLMAQQLINVGKFNQTKPWIKEFFKRFNTNEDEAFDIKKHIIGNLMIIGDIEMTWKIFQSILADDGDSFESLTKIYKNQYILSEAYEEEQGYHSTNEFKLYEKVCREEVTRSPSEERDLRCRFHWGQCSFCRLAPFKVEDINMDPVVMIFHDMITDKQIEFIKGFAVPNMERSIVRDDYGGFSKRENYRISKNAWLPYDIHSSTLKLLRDLDDVTGLDMRESEELQVANYGFGGHYEPHFDFYLSVIDETQNNRIATSIFYLSDVEQGGATAFPILKIAVKPSKGDVLFWYNLHRSLDGDYRTKHAGCPVLKGSKWIGNVWTPDRNQAARRPCLLYRDNASSMEYQVN